MNKYNFKHNDVVHSLDVKISQNSKIGFGIVLQTYHFSIEQIENNDFTLDEKNCLDCPYSFNQNNGKSGKCYTHKGMQLMGLKSKLKSLHKQNLQGKIKEFNSDDFRKFISHSSIKKIDLIRFGAYGEAVTLPLEVRDTLFDVQNILGCKVTSYTHQWRTANETRFMASTHNLAEMLQAKKLGYRCFTVTAEAIDNAFNCPASKESERKKTCVQCGLCDGQVSGKRKKDIYILKH